MPSKKKTHERLDLELVKRGLVESRQKAQTSILAGQVWVNQQRAQKSSAFCAHEDSIEIRGGERFVGRGGTKLESALTHFQINPKDWNCLDVGASTGGFTDCLLQHGAASVTAIDVGEGQLHWKLRQDPRVITKEGINARFLKPEDFPEKFHLAVMDLSFISLRTVLPAIFPLLLPHGEICALIKPQFEAGPALVGKGGIVRDPKVHELVISGLQTWLQDQPVQNKGVFPSTLPGRDGNQEFFWYLGIA